METPTDTVKSTGIQRLILCALVAICVGPFLVNTTPDEKARMTIKAVALAAAFGCIYLNRVRFIIQPSLPGACLGGLLVLAGCLLTLADARQWLREPGLAFILGPAGIALAATGFHFTRLHWRCTGLFTIAALPAGTMENLIEHGLGYSKIIAHIAAFSLHYVGFNVATQGDSIHVNGQTVRVIAECSGLKLFFLLFTFFFIILLLLPDTRRIVWRMFFAAVGTGLVISILRVDLLVLIVNNAKWFEFFHHGMGSELISMVAILIFGYFIKEPVITALEKHIPVPPLTEDNLPATQHEKPLKISLVAYTVLGLATAAVAYAVT